MGMDFGGNGLLDQLTGEARAAAQGTLDEMRALRLTQEMALRNAKLAGDLVRELASVHELMRETLDRIGNGSVIGPEELRGRRVVHALAVQRSAALLERYAAGSDTLRTS